MSGKNSELNPLVSRKQLLLAESELNRAQLLGDVTELKTDVQGLINRVRSFRSLAGVATLLVAGVTVLRHGKHAAAPPRSSWLQALVHGGGLISMLWSSFRSKVVPRAKPPPDPHG